MSNTATRAKTQRVDAPDPGSTLLYFRAPNALVAEVDVHKAKLQERAGIGIIISRAAALHQLIRDGLAAAARKARK